MVGLGAESSAFACAELHHDLVNTSNTNSLSAVLAGIEDLNNNYLPGVEHLVDQGKVKTYFPGSPYDAVGEHGLARAEHEICPLNDPAFRRALAEAIDVNKIVKQDYHNVLPPAQPTGLLPTWKKYINNSLGRSERLQAADTAAAVGC